MKWEEKEIEYLINNYCDEKTSDISIKLDRTVASISDKARQLNLKKSKEHLSKISIEKNEFYKWDETDTIYFINNYHNNKNKVLSEKLNRTVVAIENKARQLNLTKSKKHRSMLATEKNELSESHLTDMELKEIASLYKTRGIFSYSNINAYGIACRRGILDEICTHMIPQRCSMPQLMCKYIFDKLIGEKCEYNTRKIIKPYELDLYYPTYKLGIEYNGKYWHSEKFNDNTELKIELCKDLNIKLIVIEEDGRNYEEDIKRDIIKNLSYINKVLKKKKKIKEEDILNIEIDNSIFDVLIDSESVFEITKQYILYSDFKRNETSLFNKLKRLKQLDKYTSNLIK